MGKGGKERLVPVLPVTRDAIARYIALCPYLRAPIRHCSWAPRAAV